MAASSSPFRRSVALFLDELEQIQLTCKLGEDVVRALRNAFINAIFVAFEGNLERDICNEVLKREQRKRAVHRATKFRRFPYFTYEGFEDEESVVEDIFDDQDIVEEDVQAFEVNESEELVIGLKTEAENFEECIPSSEPEDQLEGSSSSASPNKGRDEKPNSVRSGKESGKVALEEMLEILEEGGVSADALSPIVEDTNIHCCVICGKEFSRAVGLSRHMASVHDVRDHNSRGRPKKAFALFQESHSEGCASEKKKSVYETCGVCDTQFADKKSLRKHLKTIHNMEDEALKPMKVGIDEEDERQEILCQMCGEVCVGYTNLRMHMKTEHFVLLKKKLTKLQRMSGNRFCEKCQREFPRSDNLRRHMKARHGVELPSRRGSSREDDSSGNTSTPEKEKSVKGSPSMKRQACYKCDVCQETFPRKRLLLAHAKEVHGGRGVSSKKKKPLTKEMRRTGNRLCPHCGCEFARTDNLKRHVRDMHGEDGRSPRRYECDVCHKQFPHRSGAVYHRDLHFPKQNQCNVCQKTFSHRHKLKNHLRVHENKEHPCPACKKVFAANHLMKKHLQLNHPTTLGEPAARPPRHLRNSLDAFSCKMCAKMFASQPSLNFHYEKSHDVIVKDEEDVIVMPLTEFYATYQIQEPA